MLNWFARLWEIDEEEYWGYITNCGTEGNLHGILVGRENLPDGILYASRETHYSVFKAARMYRMDACKVGGGAGHSDFLWRSWRGWQCRCSAGAAAQLSWGPSWLPSVCLASTGVDILPTVLYCTALYCCRWAPLRAGRLTTRS